MYFEEYIHYVVFSISLTMAQCTKSRYSAVLEQYALCTLFKHAPQTTMALYTKIIYYMVLCTFEPLQPSARTVCTAYFQAQAPLRALHLSPLHTSSLLNQVHSAPPLLPRQPFFSFNYFSPSSLFLPFLQSFSPSSPALLFLKDGWMQASLTSLWSCPNFSSSSGHEGLRAHG